MKFLCSIVLLVISTSLFAEDIVMECETQNYDIKRVYKFENSIFGDSVLTKIRGKWIKFCSIENKKAVDDEMTKTGREKSGWKIIQQKAEIYDNSVMCNV